MKKFKTLLAMIGLMGLSGVACSQQTSVTAPKPPAQTSHAAAFDFAKRTVKLNNGIEMPIIGIGTWTLTPEQAERSVAHALKSGYRLIDTAQMYRNEDGVGRAVRNSGIPRSEIFITTKIYGNYANAEQAINDRLRALDVGYIDLLLLHAPATDDTHAYQVMEQFVKQGKIRAIGLSNYHRKTFDRIMQTATITPSVVQNEIHPYHQDNATKNYLHSFGTQMEAWYPLGGRNSYGMGGKETLFNDPVIQNIAQKHRKTPAQILLRWQLQAGNIAIPGSSKPKHIEENIAIFDFALSEEEMRQINGLDKGQKFSNFGGEE